MTEALSLLAYVALTVSVAGLLVGSFAPRSPR